MPQERRRPEGEQLPGGRGFRPARRCPAGPVEKPGPVDIQPVVGFPSTAWDPFILTKSSHGLGYYHSRGPSAANPGKLNVQTGPEAQQLLEAGSVQRDDCCSLKSKWRDWQRKEIVPGAVTHLAYSSGQGIYESSPSGSGALWTAGSQSSPESCSSAPPQLFTPSLASRGDGPFWEPQE